MSPLFQSMGTSPSCHDLNMTEGGLATSSASSLRIYRCRSPCTCLLSGSFILPVPAFNFCNLSSVAAALTGQILRQKIMDYLGIVRVCTLVSYILPERNTFSLVFLLLLLISLARFTSVIALSILTIFQIFGLFFCIPPRIPVPSFSILFIQEFLVHPCKLPGLP